MSTVSAERIGARGVTSFVCLLITTVSSGCLSATYHLHRDELIRLAEVAPESRGNEVRVVQGVFGASPGGGYRERPVDPAVVASAAIATHVATQDIRDGVRALRSDGGGPSAPRVSGSDDDGIDLSGDGGAAAIAVIAVAVVSIGVVIMATLAATEGSRFDGWVAIDPSQTLYLIYGDGSREMMPLYALTPAHARAAAQGLIVEGEGPTFEALERASLDRVGATFALDLGASGTSANGAWWPRVQLGVGGFFLQQLGLLATLDGVFGSQDGLLMNLRYGGELDAYPLEFSPFSLGIYASAFDNHRVQALPTGETEQRHAFGWSAGILMQFEVTTRLAITLRGGPLMVHEPNHDVISGSVTVGAAIY